MGEIDIDTTDDKWGNEADDEADDEAWVDDVVRDNCVYCKQDNAKMEGVDEANAPLFGVDERALDDDAFFRFVPPGFGLFDL